MSESLDLRPTLLETQMPVNLLSAEAYKERKAGPGQTLTCLGSYWKGRKPLILVRACVLAGLFPAGDDARRDRAIFLKLMRMDEASLRVRKNKPVSAALVREALGEAARASVIFGAAPDAASWRRDVAPAVRVEAQEQAWQRLSYEFKLTICARPEEVAEAEWPDIWPEVNAHLGTDAQSIPELVEQLGQRRFGHRPRVADPFCGGGSIPFEAARVGCDVYASDLNPIAGMLTWGALNIVGGPPEQHAQIRAAQARVAAAVREEIDALGIEHRPIRRNVTGCRGLGRCLQGCPRGAKNSADRTLLADALLSDSADRASGAWGLPREADVSIELLEAEINAAVAQATGIVLRAPRALPGVL